MKYWVVMLALVVGCGTQQDGTNDRPGTEGAPDAEAPMGTRVPAMVEEKPPAAETPGALPAQDTGQSRDGGSSGGDVGGGGSDATAGTVVGNDAGAAPDAQASSPDAEPALPPDAGASCGATGQACCWGGTCGAGLFCAVPRGGTYGKCQTRDPELDVGRPCPLGVCPGGTACLFPENAQPGDTKVCRRCGGEGQPPCGFFPSSQQQIVCNEGLGGFGDYCSKICGANSSNTSCCSVAPSPTDSDPTHAACRSTASHCDRYAYTCVSN